MNYNFLASLTLVDTGRMRQPKEKHPTGMAIRLYTNGEVYPSKELVQKYNLEYVNKDSTEKSNGIDVIDSLEWGPLVNQPRMIIFGFAPKSEPKVDLFGTCRFNDDNTPKSSVLTQAPVSENLVNLCRSLGFLNEDQKYVDLVILEQYPLNIKDGLAFIPKTVERGERKGEKTYERRENILFFPVTTSEEFEKMNQKNKTTENIETEQEVITTN